MIGAPDRKRAVRLIRETVDAGARTHSACNEMGISMRTFQRWTQEGEVKADGRPGADRPPPGNKLTPQERQSFDVERIRGSFDPTMTWTRVSGLGPLSIQSRETLIDRFLNGGPLMWPLALLLLLTGCMTSLPSEEVTARQVDLPRAEALPPMKAFAGTAITRPQRPNAQIATDFLDLAFEAFNLALVEQQAPSPNRVMTRIPGCIIGTHVTTDEKGLAASKGGRVLADRRGEVPIDLAEGVEGGGPPCLVGLFGALAGGDEIPTRDLQGTPRVLLVAEDHQFADADIALEAEVEAIGVAQPIEPAPRRNRTLRAMSTR